jgi:hypothetical protein
MYLTRIWSFVSSLPSARKIPAGFGASLEEDSTAFSLELEAGAATLEAGVVALDAGAATLLDSGFGVTVALDVGVTAALDSGFGVTLALDSGVVTTAALDVGSGFVPGPQASGKLDAKQDSSPPAC